MEWLYLLQTNLVPLFHFQTRIAIHKSQIKNASTLTGFSFTQPPTGREYAGRDWRSRFIVRNGKRFPLPIRPPACCSGCPHRAEVSLWLPLELSTTESPAPDAARCLPSPVTVLRFTPMGRLVFAKLIVRRNLFKGKPLKAAAYWYSVVKFPTFRRKALAIKLVLMIKDCLEFFYS